MRNSCIVSYDVADPKRLRQVFKTMGAWGDHLQFSVFEHQLTRMDVVRLRAELADIVHHDGDQVDKMAQRDGILWQPIPEGH